MRGVTSEREIETRGTRLPVELRRSASSRAIGGYAATFNRTSQNLGGFFEVVEPSAFSKSQAGGFPGVVCRFDHDNAMLLGTTAAGTLRLQIDSNGLDYTVDCPQSRDDTIELVSRGDIRNSSFSFQTFDQEFTHNGGELLRHLISVKLIDVSPVVTPAYEDSTVALRSLGVQFDADPEDVFDMARDNQLSKLFVRTDNRGPQRKTRSGAEALKELTGLTTDEKRRRTWHQAQTELMGVRWSTERRSARQAQLETMAVRWGPKKRSGREARQETEAMYRP
jgi:Escherichia/Staphylococcus phage prohead protease